MTARDREASVADVDVELVVTDAQVDDDARSAARLASNVVCNASRNASTLNEPFGGERPQPAPAPEREEHRLEPGAGLGQLVDHGPDRRPQPALAHDPGPLQLAQPLRQHVLAHRAEPAVQVREPLRAVEQLPDDEQRPSLAHRVEGPGDPAAVAVGPSAAASDASDSAIHRHRSRFSSETAVGTPNLGAEPDSEERS